MKPGWCAYACDKVNANCSTPNNCVLSTQTLPNNSPVTCLFNVHIQLILVSTYFHWIEFLRKNLYFLVQFYVSTSNAVLSHGGAVALIADLLFPSGISPFLKPIHCQVRRPVVATQRNDWPLYIDLTLVVFLPCFLHDRFYLAWTLEFSQLKWQYDHLKFFQKENRDAFGKLDIIVNNN